MEHTFLIPAPTHKFSLPSLPSLIREAENWLTSLKKHAQEDTNALLPLLGNSGKLKNLNIYIKHLFTRNYINHTSLPSLNHHNSLETQFSSFSNFPKLNLCFPKCVFTFPNFTFNFPKIMKIIKNTSKLSSESHEKTTTPQKLTHDRLQQECFQYLWNKYPQTRRTFWHTPNEFIPDTYIQIQCRITTKNQIPKWLSIIFSMYDKHFISNLSKRKAMGVLPGVTDLVWYWRGVLYCFDIKLPGDTLSDKQIQFIKATRDQGGKFYEVNTLEGFIAQVDMVMIVYP